MPQLPYLTQMRQSVWDAIDNWPALRDVFKQKWRLEDVGVFNEAKLVPKLGALPALAIVPSSGESGWITNQGQRIRYGLDIILYTARLDVRRAELLWQEILRAFWQCAPPGTTRTYIAAATSDISVASGPSISELGEISRWAWPMTLAYDWNPRLDTGALVTEV